MPLDHAHYMDLAIGLSREAGLRGDRPLGSLLVIGGRHAGIGRTDLGRYAVETMLEFTGRQLEVVTGVRTVECESMRLAWIAERATRGLGPR